MESTLSNRSSSAVTYVWEDSPSHSRSSPSTHGWTLCNERYSCCCPLSSTVFVVTSTLRRRSSSSLFDRYVCRYSWLHLKKIRLFSFFSIIEDDLTLRNILRNQITHLHIDVCTTSEVNSNTVSNTFELVLSLCERLTELDLSEGFFRKGLRRPSVFLIHNKNFLSSTLTKLKINVATLFDCLLLLDGRLDSLSTLIINVAYIFDPVVDIGHNVSSTNRSSPCWFPTYF